MTETEQLALRTLFLAAVVVAGLSLSYVPHVELVTLVVFSAGVALGSRGGASVGAVGMVLYVFANSALKGFPPSPLPILAAQAVAASIPGWAGGLWRRWWLSGGRARVWALAALPVVGLALAAVGQAILNAAFAWFLAGGATGRWVTFATGMTAGAIDMVVNAVLFLLAGPRVASTLRRLARARGWWRTAPVSVILAAVIVCWGPPPALGEDVPVPAAPDTSTAEPEAAFPDSSAAGPETAFPDTLGGSGEAVAPDTLGAGAGPASADTLGAGAGTTPADTLSAPDTRAAARRPLRPLRLRSLPLWQAFGAAEASVRGLPSLRSLAPGPALEPSLTPVPAVSPVWERWGIGWGRTRYSYDGLPLAGPVHDAGEPPDLPLAWSGTWREKWTATGTSVDLSAPPAPDRPESQVSLTTGSLGRRTAEFALFRNLGPVNVGVDFADREEQGLYLLNESSGSRVWIRLESTTGRRPDWSVDVSGGNEEQRLFSGVEFERVSRRVQGSLRGPLLGGQTRVALQLRRQALQIRRTAPPVGELLFDGFTLKADWAAPAAVHAWVRWDQDRRRGVLEANRSFRGLRAGAGWSRQAEPWAFAVEAEAGHQEPYGTTWEASAVAGIDRERWGARVSVGHEENLPALVLGLDRMYPEYGLPEYLERFESAAEPETRTGVRAEVAWRPGRVVANLGGWLTALRHYRIDSNPLWLPLISPYAPASFPSPNADITGAYGELEIDLGRGLRARGSGRVHSRAALEVPYLPAWYGEGSLHWRRPWFSDSMDLDASVGGILLGPRRTPAGDEYPTGGLGYVRLTGRVDNGIVTLSFHNLLDAYLESDFRDSDVVTPVPVSGRVFLLGLTMYLEN